LTTLSVSSVSTPSIVTALLGLFFSSYGHLRHLHSFPTRRSADLAPPPRAPGRRSPAGRRAPARARGRSLGLRAARRPGSGPGRCDRPTRRPASRGLPAPVPWSRARERNPDRRPARPAATRDTGVVAL